MEFVFASERIASSTTRRFLGYDSTRRSVEHRLFDHPAVVGLARPTEADVCVAASPPDFTITEMIVMHTRGAGNGSRLLYTVRVDGSDTCAQSGLASTFAGRARFHIPELVVCRGASTVSVAVDPQESMGQSPTGIIVLVRCRRLDKDPYRTDGKGR